MCGWLPHATQPRYLRRSDVGYAGWRRADVSRRKPTSVRRRLTSAGVSRRQPASDRRRLTSAFACRRQPTYTSTGMLDSLKGAIHLVRTHERGEQVWKMRPVLRTSAYVGGAGVNPSWKKLKVILIHLTHSIKCADDLKDTLCSLLFNSNYMYMHFTAYLSNFIFLSFRLDALPPWLTHGCAWLHALLSGNCPGFPRMVKTCMIHENMDE